MGKIEKTVRARRKKENIQKAILGTIGLAGVLSVAVVAPNALRFLPNAGKFRNWNYRAQNSLAGLIKRGLVSIETGKEGERVHLTEAGEKMFELEFKKAELKKEKRKWDGQWRVVIFDIPEARRRMRDQLRSLMKEIGFYRIQDSVWVFPYDCEDLLTLIKVELKSGKGVAYGVLSALENDDTARVHFGLSKVK